MTHGTTTVEESLAPDDQLVEAILEGRDAAAAWDALLARYGRLIYTVPLRYGLQESDAADVYQEVCEALWRGLGNLRDRDRLAPWLLTVAGHSSWRLIKRRRRLAHREDGLDQGELSQPDPQPRPDELLVRQEEWRAVGAALRDLPERCQHLLRYLYYDPVPLSYEEIARRLDLAVGSIGPIRGRCLAQLKRRLAAEQP